MPIVTSIEQINQLKQKLRNQALNELQQLNAKRGFSWMQKEKINRQLKGDIARLEEAVDALKKLKLDPENEHLKNNVTELLTVINQHYQQPLEQPLSIQ